jgi:rhodanese-related sulfurtransferase
MTTTATPPTTRPGTEVDSATLKRWLESTQAWLIDVREPDEHAREHIAGARNVPLGRIDSVLSEIPESQRIVFHCQSGRRAAEALARAARISSREMFNLTRGIEGWKAAGLQTVVNRAAPIPIMRQVQIVVGSMVLLGSVLAALVSPWFLLLTGFFGAGLLFAGLTGTCGMAAVLGWMPWNRFPKDK